MLKRLLARASNRTLFSVMLCADVVVFAAGIPLERYCLLAAADRSSTALLILALLGANVVLLGVLLVAVASSSILMTRTVSRFLGKPVAVVRGEVDVSGQVSSLTKTPPN